MESKSRHQSKLDFLDSLTKEYFQALLRSHIYLSAVDRRYWGKVAKFKKERIVDVGKDISAPVIFEDEALYDNYERHYNPKGSYSLLLEKKEDFKSYFSKGADIVSHDKSGSGIGKIKTYDYERGYVVVALYPSKEEVEVQANLVKRVL